MTYSRGQAREKRMANNMSENTELSYSEAAILIDGWLPMSVGKWFESKELWVEFNVFSAAGKHSISQVLTNYKAKGILEGAKGRYRYIDSTVEVLDWVKADVTNILDIKWPYGLQDNSSFGFDGNITLYPGSIVVISGVSNMGKTTFLLNLIVRNMDDWKVRYLTNEMQADEFADRIQHFTSFYDLTNDNDEPKFETAVRYDNYQDVVVPDGMTIIDYLDPGENPYMVGQQIDAIKQRIGNGVAIIALQKKMTTVTTKNGPKEIISDYGTGGQYSEHRARLVLHIEKDHLYVKKAKKCRKYQLGGKRFKYEIVEGGSQFLGIHEWIKTEEGQEGA